MKKSVVLGMLVLAVLFVQIGPVLADKSSVSIEGPSSVEKGTEVTLRINVMHNANSSSHFTEWVKVTANKKEIDRWDYTQDKRPEAAKFTKEIKVKITEETEIVAEASCNKHGSKGPATFRINVK